MTEENTKMTEEELNEYLKLTPEFIAEAEKSLEFSISAAEDKIKQQSEANLSEPLKAPSIN